MKIALIKQGVNKLIFNVFGEKVNNKISNLRLLISDYNGREHYKKYGELNPEKTIYLVRKSLAYGEGLLSIFTYVMGRIDFADRNGMLPFVDIDVENHFSVFDRYFILKTELTKEEVYKSKKVLLSGYGCKPVYPGWCNWINTEFNDQKRALFDKYIDFSEEIKDMVNNALEEIQPEKCLGLYLRGTDYASLKPAGHPIQPEFSDVIPHIDKILEEENLNLIFLVTEDQGIYEKVKDRYQEKVVVVKNDRFFSEYKHGDDILRVIDKNSEAEQSNMLYLTKIILLSMCHSFVGGRTNGSSVANALNGGKYKRRFVYDVGYYK